jgi:hypothetical protein
MSEVYRAHDDRLRRDVADQGQPLRVHRTLKVAYLLSFFYARRRRVPAGK